MVTTGNFVHSANGGYDNMVASGYYPVSWGEISAKGSATPATIVNGWATHYSHSWAIYGAYEDVGIAYENSYWTVVVGTEADALM